MVMKLKKDTDIVGTNEKKTRQRKLYTKTVCASFLLGLLWFSVLIFTLVGDPILLALKYYTRVTNGSFVHQIMMKELEGIHFQTFLFNISNAQEFMTGVDDKLKVQEVGPFTYKEMRSTRDIEIDQTNELMRYTPNIRIVFVPEESIGQPEDTSVTMPNIPMLGLTSKMADSLYLTQIAFNMLTAQLESKPIVSLDAHNYLWGYHEPLVTLAHNLVPGSIHFDKMGVLDRLYDPQKKVRLEISIADDEKYMIKKLNGHRKLAMGDGDPEFCSLCNTFENTYEGVGYRPGMPSDFPIKLYRLGLCRILEMEYYGTKLMDYGAEALVYHFSDSFFTLDPNKTSNGMIALPECFMGIPLAISKPHFVDVDPSFYEKIDGMKPNPEKFEGWITVDPRIGLQLETVVSLQINLVIGDVSSNAKARRFSNMVLPICYLQIKQPPLPDESKGFLNAVYYIGPRIILGVQISLMILLAICWGYFSKTVYRYYKLKEDTTMSFAMDTNIKEINANDVEEPMVNESQKAESR